jgi:hypothetical protein
MDIIERENRFLKGGEGSDELKARVKKLEKVIRGLEEDNQSTKAELIRKEKEAEVEREGKIREL